MIPDLNIQIWYFGADLPEALSLGSAFTYAIFYNQVWFFIEGWLIAVHVVNHDLKILLYFFRIFYKNYKNSDG